MNPSWCAAVAQRHEIDHPGRTGVGLEVGLQDQCAFAVAPGHPAHRALTSTAANGRSPRYQGARLSRPASPCAEGTANRSIRSVPRARWCGGHQSARSLQSSLGPPSSGPGHRVGPDDGRLSLTLRRRDVGPSASVRARQKPGVWRAHVLEGVGSAMTATWKVPEPPAILVRSLTGGSLGQSGRWTVLGRRSAAEQPRCLAPPRHAAGRAASHSATSKHLIPPGWCSC